MSDDIVARLRKTLAMGATPEHGVIVVRFHFISTVNEWIDDVHLTAKAADEIERLRGELARKETEINRVHAELVKYTGDGHTLSEPYTPEAL